jgi:hypothetical protein
MRLTCADALENKWKERENIKLQGVKFHVIVEEELLGGSVQTKFGNVVVVNV